LVGVNSKSFTKIACEVIFIGLLVKRILFIIHKSKDETPQLVSNIMILFFF